MGQVWSEKSAQKQGTSEPELWHTGVQYYVNLLAHNKCDPDGVKVDQKPAKLVVDCLDEYHRVLDAWDTTNQDVAANRINFACVLFKSFGYFVLLVLSIPFLLPGTRTVRQRTVRRRGRVVEAETETVRQRQRQ